MVLPECFSFLGRGEGEKLGHAESFEDPAGTPGPVLATLRELAARHGVWIVGGGTPERVPGDPRRSYNTALVVDPRGELAARYRKIHLFDVDIPGGAVLRESDSTARGSEPVVVDVGRGAGRASRSATTSGSRSSTGALVKDLGAEVLLVPAAFTAHTGAAHWHLLLRARAIEDQAWVVAAAQWGRHSEKRESYGHSLIVDPWGAVVGERAEGDGVVVAHARRRDGREAPRPRCRACRTPCCGAEDKRPPAARSDPGDRAEARDLVGFAVRPRD